MTIRLDEQLLAEAKQVAAQLGRTLSALIEEALRESLARNRHPRQHRPPVPISKGHRLQPGVDLDNNAALLDLMEGT